MRDDSVVRLLEASEDGKYIALTTDSNTMIDLTERDAYGAHIKTIHSAHIVFLRYTATPECRFYIPKDRNRTKASTLEALSVLFPTISSSNWQYDGYSVSLQEGEDQMMMRMAHNVG